MKGTTQFSQERVRLKINQSKLVFPAQWVQRYFPEKESG